MLREAAVAKIIEHLGDAALDATEPRLVDEVECRGPVDVVNARGAVIHDGSLFAVAGVLAPAAGDKA